MRRQATDSQFCYGKEHVASREFVCGGAIVSAGAWDKYCRQTEWVACCRGTTYVAMALTYKVGCPTQSDGLQNHALQFGYQHTQQLRTDVNATHSLSLWQECTSVLPMRVRYLHPNNPHAPLPKCLHALSPASQPYTI